MSHVLCAACGGREHVQGYGFAAGVFGGYTICECGAVLELWPHTEGLSEAETIQVEAKVARVLAGSVKP